MNIILTSQTLSRSELEAGLSLTRAFFPEARIRVEEALSRDFAWESQGGLSGNSMLMDPSNRLSQFSKAHPQTGDALLRIEVSYPKSPWQVEGYFTDKASGEVSVKLDQHQVQTILSYNQVGKETEKKLLFKQGLYVLLSKVTGHVPPWGILTGIRPSKILHRLYDLGMSEDFAARVLRKRYSIREDKIRLLEEIVSVQRPILQEITYHPERVAVYVGIPFCPTRCTYCSFPAYSLQKGRESLTAYLQGLYEEIQVTGEWMKETGRSADSLYIGGGTPTILTTEEITDLLRWIRKHIPTPDDSDLGKSAEILRTQGFQGAQNYYKELEPSGIVGGARYLELTVEAGRPDTLTREKLLALREQGVNRLSINPQTMHERTLKRIGRFHTVKDILRVYEMAREISGWVINMDLILGLPGETVEDVRESLRQIGELQPDNLTVHALAIKRGSKEHETGLIQNLSEELEAMQENVLAIARSWGMRPYYLYRQKQIAGNLENIGFARPEMECRYNIGIMEERQNVIGIGAGASSKVVNPVDYSLINLQHPSNWQVYLERWREVHEKRVKKREKF